ncbi:MAG: methyl-accepting chemotaxis protein [Pseudomonadota bacterium]
MKWFQSVSSRITLAIVSIGVVTAIALAIGTVVFQAVSEQVRAVNSERVPRIEAATHLIITTSGLNKTLNGINSARTDTEVTRLIAQVQQGTAQARAILDRLDPDTAADLRVRVERADQALKLLIEARANDFRNQVRIRQSLEEMTALKTSITTALEAVLDDSYFDLVISGEDAIGSVSAVLTNLLDRDIQTLRIAQQIRAETNLLSGLLIATTQNRDPATLSILRDLADGATRRLLSDLSALQAFSIDQASIDALQEAADFFEAAFRAGQPTGRDVARALSTRQAVDGVLSELLDDLEFNVTIEAETAKDANAETIQTLLDNQVGKIVEIAALESAVRAFVALALQGAFAPDQPSIIVLQERATAAAAVLEEALLTDQPGISQQVKALLAFADPDRGVLALRGEVLSAGKTAVQLAADASATVAQISQDAAEASEAALERIASSGRVLSEEADLALSAMTVLSGIGIVAFVATRLFVSRVVSRPLAALSQKTESLSEGDTAPIGRLTERAGEIGRMASALEVFRSNAIAMEELRDDNARRQEEAQQRQQAMIELLSREIGSVVDRGSRGDFSGRVAHAFDDPQLATLADGVNRLVISVEDGVQEAKNSLTALANADLRYRMDDRFEGIFADLREQANVASGRLSRMISEIRAAADVSTSRSQQVAQGAHALARQAESQAATVEETSATMKDMTDIVQSSAGALAEAARLSRLVAEKTRTGSASATRAVESVQEIAEHSEKITQINTVIDSISLQTNLLALNAAVEAARAGEAGKGFAVVAAEVRDLAQRSAKAANEIDALVRQSTKSIETGVNSVRETSKALEDIEASTQPVLAAIENVSDNGGEQAKRIEEISVAVLGIDDITQQNAMLAEESARHTIDLNAQIKALHDSASSFKLAQNMEGSSPVFEDAV